MKNKFLCKGIFNAKNSIAMCPAYNEQFRDIFLPLVVGEPNVLRFCNFVILTAVLL